MITVTYHLVRQRDEPWLRGLHAITPEALEGQLEHLARHHNVLAPEEVVAAARAGGLPPNAVCLTFDDGSTGQLEHALPVLQRLGLKAFFFVPTSILELRRVPVVEKQRILQYACGPYEDFYASFTEAVARRVPGLARSRYEATEENLEIALGYYAEYDFYSPRERLFRQVRETVLDESQFAGVIDEMFAGAFSEDDFAGRYFLDWEGVRELAAAGMTVGGHGHLHLTDTGVPPDVAAADARHAIGLLARRLGCTVESYAYPYGIFVSQTVDEIASAGVQVAFTCRAGIGWDGGPLRLDRLDCAQFPKEPSAPLSGWSQLERATAG